MSRLDSGFTLYRKLISHALCYNMVEGVASDVQLCVCMRIEIIVSVSVSLCECESVIVSLCEYVSV